MTMRLFIDVDVQNDFCRATGSLYVPGSPNDLYRKLVAHADEKGIPIVGSVDSHSFDAWEFASSPKLGPNGEKPNFPDHCVKGTQGWLKVEGTLPRRFRFVPNVAGVDAHALALELASGEAGGIYFEKEVYSLFANPNAEAVLASLRARAQSSLECVVFGVATDYCVRAAALGLRERGHEAILLEDAVRGITDEGTRAALDEMRAAGVRVTSSAELLGIS
jgi:nicotinamidase/pyrazinamidase